MSKPYTVRWGIMATGGIARTFTKDLLVDPKTRDVTDVIHTVVAVASSSSVDSAKKFVSDVVEPKQKDIKCATYGSYAELVKDSNVDVVYVASPHSHHYQNAMLCLTNNKPVLCEKALTVNADQAKKLISLAKEKNLFFMEAVWTRYFPLSITIRDHIQKGTIGEVLRTTADNCPGAVADEFDKGSRMVNPDLAGGVLLDLGIYSLTWIFQTLYHTIPPAERKPPTVAAQITAYPRTGADAMTSMLLSFPRSTPTGNNKSHGIATTSFDIYDNPDKEGTAGPSIRIFGTKGEIQVWPPAYRPTKIRIVPTSGKAETIDFPIPEGHGMHWEADEVARCLRDGKLESETLSWEESIVIMETMDEVRKQGGLKYPDAIETTDYPVDLAAKGL